VVVDVVARRLRGHPRGLLHGNGDDGERSGLGAHGDVLYKGMEDGMEDGLDVSGKYLEGSNAFALALLDIPHDGNRPR
jgi:hypothetical protein